MPYIPPRPIAPASSASSASSADIQPQSQPVPSTSPPDQAVASTSTSLPPASASAPAPPPTSAPPRLRVTEPEPEGDLTPRPVDMPPPPPPLHSLPSTLAAMSIHTDPPTTAAQVRQLDGQMGAEVFSPASQPLEAAPPQKPKPTQTQTGSQDDVPGLSAGSTTSASSTSIESLDSYGGDAGGVSPPSSGTGTGTGTGDDGKSTPATSVGVVDLDDDREDNVRRYKRGLYLYTRELYLEAKLSSSRTDKRRGSTGGTSSYAQFGQKQSGMERLAQKKALARRLNG